MATAPPTNPTTSPSPLPQQPQPQPPQPVAAPPTQHLIILTGPSGSGKTTLGQHLSRALHLPLVEGDDHHSAANISKMAAGIPLADADRWDWLVALREHCVAQLLLLPPQTQHTAAAAAAAAATTPPKALLLTCSALKRKYRDVFRCAPYFAPSLRLHFLVLRAPPALLHARVAGREGHYMKDELVGSQVAAAEAPGAEEWDCVVLDVEGEGEVGRRAEGCVRGWVWGPEADGVGDGKGIR